MVDGVKSLRERKTARGPFPCSRLSSTLSVNSIVASRVASSETILALICHSLIYFTIVIKPDKVMPPALDNFPLVPFPLYKENGQNRGFSLSRYPRPKKVSKFYLLVFRQKLENPSLH